MVVEFDPPPLFMETCSYCVYILKGKDNKSIYMGYTNDLKRRFEEHNKGLCICTKDMRPLKIIAYEAYASETDARTRERRLKQFKNSYKELMKRISNCLEK